MCGGRRGGNTVYPGYSTEEGERIQGRQWRSSRNQRWKWGICLKPYIKVMKSPLLHIVTGPGIGIGNPLQYSCLENSMDRGAWWVAVHGVSEESDATEQVSRQIMSNVEHLFMCLIVINLWPFNLSSQILFCSLRSSFWKLDFSV